MKTKSLTNKSYRFAFILITSLFFLWGFAHNLDPILIPHLKKSFTLTTVQATLIDSSVFIAYFVMALPALSTTVVPKISKSATSFLIGNPIAPMFSASF